MGIIKSHLIAPNSQEGSRSGQLITKQILDYSEQGKEDVVFGSFWAASPIPVTFNIHVPYAH